MQSSNEMSYGSNVGPALCGRPRAEAPLRNNGTETIEGAVLRSDDERSPGRSGRSRERPAGVEVPEFLSRRQTENVQVPVVGTHKNSVSGDKRRRLDAPPRGKSPQGLSGGPVQTMNHLVAPA